MRIVRTIINNFRNIKNLTFHPSQHNVIIGQVNAGKSTLLNALALVLDPDMNRRFQVVDEMDFYGMKLKKSGGQPIVINIELTLAGCSDPERNFFLDYWEPWNNKTNTLIEDTDDIKILDNDQYEFAFRISFRAAYDPTEDGIVYYWYYPKFSFLGGSIDYRICPRTDREKIGFFIIPAERDVRKALSFSRYSALDKALRADKINLETQLRMIVEQVKGRGELLFENAEFSTLVEEMEKQVETLLHLQPDVKRKLFFELSALGHYDIMNVLRAFIAIAGQDQAYPISSQGMGAKQILVLSALRMLSKRRQSSILAVEEPEIGLHPHMQRTLIDDLLRSSSQTFISTHSIHVAQTAENSHVFCLLNTGGGDCRIATVAPTIAQGCSAETIRAVVQLNGHYPSDTLDALFAPSVLLVEGVGDREAIPVLLRRLCQAPSSMKRTLDSLGIAVVPCQSKQSIPKIAPYFKNQLGKQVLALVDNEPSTKDDNTNVVTACECTFIWPLGCAIEKILLMKASESTVDHFIEHVTKLGDDYFDKALSKKKNSNEKRKDVFNYLKNKKAGHRHFAELLPVHEIAKPVRQLLNSLNLITKVAKRYKTEVKLGT